MITKTCTKCNQKKSLHEFHKDKRQSDGRRCWCKLCAHKSVIQWQQDPSIKIKRATKEKSNRDLNPEAMLLALAKQRAKNRNLEFTITESDIQIPDRCPALDIPLFRGDRQVHDNSPTLDRIDPTKGYIPGNVIVVSYAANRAKGRLTIDQLRKLTDFYEYICSR